MSDSVPGITVREVSAGYGPVRVLDQVTAEIPHRRVTAILGPNGAGKSSLLNVIAGTLPATSGTILGLGPRPPAYVPQRSEVSDALPITVRATVAMGRWAHRGPWRRLTRADRAVIDDCLAELGISDLAERQLGAVSGGQRQRALVAQGLAQQADLLLLDEPAAGLDLSARSLIDDALRGARDRGTTVVRVTHDLEAAHEADHCVLLREGRVMAQGDPATVLDADTISLAWNVPTPGRPAARRGTPAG
ncbi:zinc ABC transporter ATP-binding protein AztA [Actinoalloteichus caeruleus]|uniref:Zinc/manganese transport system ATP-binding protein n=1 Tax=Actinoalloteichus caeruleus DSM 43889 TaxID=1120930 RepID=A0ABT1JCH7_ACTCY|nr:zinc ABC transporter ATP-binding protein AztA [Actinoalloteichus caeruleus]MCP2330192.1 zinc/manganese transport system ATP-binding protein [Actinoalloteichus caeruleus DSM 43889]